MLHFLNRSLTLILALFFILIGVMTLLLSVSTSVQNSLLGLIQNNFWFLLLLSLVFILIGIVLASFSFLTHRKTYLSLSSGPHLTSVSQEVIQSYLESYFQSLFPDQKVFFRLQIKKRKMRIMAELPFVPLERQKELLTQIEGDLSDMLSQNIGYTQNLEIIISFETK